jgi:diguanylate cyclase (GGDEF)-like protein/PAS domain S-box-containing protein
MKLRSTAHKRDLPGNKIQLALPAKITGIVFWGMVLVGLLTAIFLLNARENALETRYQGDAVLLAHQLEAVLQTAHNPQDLENQLQAAFAKIEPRHSFEAMEIRYPGKTLQFGQRRPDQGVFHEKLHVHSASSFLFNKPLALSVFTPSLKQAVATMRKNMLVVTGALVFIFGLILQQILQRMLSRPFANMVSSAERFADGDNQARFNEASKDEFGYLAKFINRALDSITRQQSELESSKNALFEEKERAEVTLHAIMDGVITTTADGRILYMNPVAERLSGWSSQQAHNKLLTEVIRFVHEESDEHLTNPIQRCLKDNVTEELIRHSSLIRQDGAAVPIEASAAPMRNDDGEVLGAVMVLQDVSQARRLTRQLSHQASHDALTGLYNRRMFEEQLQASLINVQEEGRHHALCYIDLDQFKIVNDTCGHMAGDELLRQLADLLQESIREGDVLARLGGDEFGVLLENCPITQASQVANKIRQQVKAFRFSWQGKSFEIGASIGVVGIDTEIFDMANIMAAADVACYTAKDMGRNRVHVYESSDAALAERHGQMHWATRIMGAIEEQRLLLYQQPVLSVNPAYQTPHCEILIRMENENGELVWPDAFIPAAERYNLMPRIDRWVIQSIFQAMAENCQKRERRIVCINLSGTSLADDGLLDYIQQTARTYNVDLHNVCFEITETAAISNLGKATHFMHELKKDGCQFSLDDFGSGLSSFAYLKNLPVDYIKIDGTFIKDISIDPIDRTMVEAIVRVGHVMQIKTVAEWVEDETTLQLLKDIGIDFVQGYHLGRPKKIEPVNEATEA